MTTQLPEDYNVPLYLFHRGENSHAYEFFGSHIEKRDDTNGIVFRVWAPKAKSISVVGDFNHWNRDHNCMMKVSENGIGGLFIPILKNFDIYK